VDNEGGQELARFLRHTFAERYQVGLPGRVVPKPRSRSWVFWLNSCG
jgi:hypothetical protein